MSKPHTWLFVVLKCRLTVIQFHSLYENDSMLLFIIARFMADLNCFCLDNDLLYHNVDHFCASEYLNDDSKVIWKRTYNYFRRLWLHKTFHNINRNVNAYSKYDSKYLHLIARRFILVQTGSWLPSSGSQGNPFMLRYCTVAEKMSLHLQSASLIHDLLQ